MARRDEKKTLPIKISQDRLVDMGHAWLAPLIDADSSGHPRFQWTRAERMPTEEEMAAVYDAICLWHDRSDTPPGMRPSGRADVPPQWLLRIKELAAEKGIWG